MTLNVGVSKSAGTFGPPGFFGPPAPPVSGVSDDVVKRNDPRRESRAKIK